MRQEPRPNRVPIMLSDLELQALDDWRRQQPDLPSRSEALRRMLDAAINPKGEP